MEKAREATEVRPSRRHATAATPKAAAWSLRRHTTATASQTATLRTTTGAAKRPGTETDTESITGAPTTVETDPQIISDPSDVSGPASEAGLEGSLTRIRRDSASGESHISTETDSARQGQDKDSCKTQ